MAFCKNLDIDVLQSTRLYLLYFSIFLLLSCLYLLPPDGRLTELERYILIHLKLPVLLTALLVGASISSASAALQVLLRNPLADPGIIGISSGASLFAAGFILLAGTPLGLYLFPAHWQTNVYALPILCFFGALLSSAIIFFLAKRMGGAISTVILAGIAISTLCSALIGWMFLVAPPSQLQSLSFWLMGSLDNTTWLSLSVAAPLCTLCLSLLLGKCRSFNRLYLGEQSALLSGLDVNTLQKHALIIVALLVGTSVSIAGSIAFLGLLVPHFIRRVHGNDNRLVMPLSALAGASIMVLCALINSVFNITLPISMLTATIGGPLFIYVLCQSRFRTAF